MRLLLQDNVFIDVTGVLTSICANSVMMLVLKVNIIKGTTLAKR